MREAQQTKTPDELGLDLSSARRAKDADGNEYLVIGDKAIPISHIDDSGVPHIKVEAKEVPNEHGGQDVIVTVPCLAVASGAHNPGE